MRRQVRQTRLGTLETHLEKGEKVENSLTGSAATYQQTLKHDCYIIPVILYLTANLTV